MIQVQVQRRDLVRYVGMPTRGRKPDPQPRFEESSGFMEEVVALFESGSSTLDIARFYGMREATIYNLLASRDMQVRG